MNGPAGRFQGAQTASESSLRLGNYLLRTTFLTGNVVTGPRLHALPASVRETLLEAVRGAGDRSGPSSLDASGGAMVTASGYRVRWWFLHLDPTLRGPSRNRYDPHQSRRVLVLELDSRARPR